LPEKGSLPDEMSDLQHVFDEPELVACTADASS